MIVIRRMDWWTDEDWEKRIEQEKEDLERFFKKPVKIVEKNDYQVVFDFLSS